MNDHFARFKLACFGIAAWIWIATLAGAESPVARLKQLQLLAEQSLQANDRDGAGQVATEILEICDLNRDPGKNSDSFLIPGDPERIAFLLFAAQLDVGIGKPKRALSTFNLVVRDADAESIDRIRAQAFLLKSRIDAGQAALDESIELLAKTSKLPDAEKTLRDECQNLVIDGVISIVLASSTDIQSPSVRVDEIENKMIDAGIPIGIARLTRFAVAISSSQNGRDDLMETELNGLANIVTEEQVTDYRRAQYWNLIAGLKIRERHYAEAFDACREFEFNIRRAGRLYQTAIARDQSALVTLLIGDYAEARKAFESTRPIHLSTVPPSGEKERLVRLENATTWRVNLAKAMEGDNEFLPARQLLQEAAKSLEHDSDELQELVSLVDNNLGLNYYLTGEFDSAAENLGRNQQLIQALPAASEWRGAALVNTGWIALGRNELESALNAFAEAADFFAKQFSTEHPRYAEALTYKARVAAKIGRIEDARQWIEQAETLVYQRVCRDLARSHSARDRIALVQEARVHPESIAWPGTVDTYLELASFLNIPPAKQYDVVLRWKGLIQRVGPETSSKRSQLIEDEQKINSRLREAYFRKVSFLRRRALEQEIDALETKLRQIQRTTESQHDPLISEAPPCTEDVVRQLKDGDLFLDIFQIRTFLPPTQQAVIGSPRRYIAFAIQNDGQVKHLSFGSVDELDAAVVLWTNTITQRSQEMTREALSEHKRSLATSASDVARLIQKPILDAVAAPKRILIRSDGATHTIPWAALPGVEGKQYWIENLRVEICNGTNVSDVAVPQQRSQEDLPEHPKSLLVVGGIDFGSLTMYPKLPGSLDEKRRVAELFRTNFPRGKVVDLESSHANEDNLLREMPGKDFIHLATHGFYHRRDEGDVFGVTGATTLLQTGLVVAPSPTAENSAHDQYLTAAEIGEIDLSGTSVVMLSACESSLGQTLAGQGVQGMLGSFHAAGAEHVVGTLWIVDDLATVTMADQFYQHLWQQEMSPADALRATQLAMIQTTKNDSTSKLLSHPYAWAAFICSAE